ncbi:MAG TPA: DUF1080 domain-containing protein [Fimbriimonadaceae bacterium]|nr:DUF1080 domain-containing protein [Fimbriimonadaceae bacterium]
MANLGYTDTPILPGTNWHVHDGSRPQPKIIDPGYPGTPHSPGVPPSDAIVLFDGRSLQGWTGKNGARWTLGDGFMEVVPGTGNIWTEQTFGDVHLHVEMASPEIVKGESQGRGNSGIFLMGLYEVQVLDCYENPTYPDGTTAAIYGQYPPLVNACRPPGQWSTYDIVFLAPVFSGEKLVSPAYMTVFFNGVLAHYHQPLMGPTQHRVLAQYKPHPATGPLELQDHGDLVRFRNIWARPMGRYDAV